MKADYDMIWQWHVTSFIWAVHFFDRMACEGEVLTARDLAVEIKAKTHHSGRAR